MLSRLVLEGTASNISLQMSCNKHLFLLNQKVWQSMGVTAEIATIQLSPGEKTGKASNFQERATGIDIVLCCSIVRTT